MSIVADMAAVAAECIRTPGRASIWSGKLGRYVCSDDPAFAQALDDLTLQASKKATIGSSFKLVFLTSAVGTLAFVLICIVATFLAGKEPAPLLEKMITSLFDLAKIGFGAVTGLLGAQALKH